MRGIKITLALGIGLMFAGPAQMALGIGTAAADRYRGGRGYYGGGHYGGGYYGGGYGYRHGGIGAGGVILGLAAVAGVAAIASSAANRDRYYDRGYGYSSGGYGYQGGSYGYPSGSYGYQGGNYGYPSGSYGYQGGSYGYQGGGYGGYGGGDYTRVAINACASAAVGQAQGWSGGARLGRVESVDRRGDDTWVRGTVRVSGGGYDRDGYGSGDGYESRGYDQREVRFSCKFDGGRVRSVRVDRPDYAYNGY